MRAQIALISVAVAIAPLTSIAGEAAGGFKANSTLTIAVANRAMAPGDVLDFSNVSRREIPAEFELDLGTASETAGFMVGLPLDVPVAAGQPLRHDYFRGAGLPRNANRVAVVVACSGAVPASVRVPDRTVGAIRARITGGGAPNPDGSKKILAISAARLERGAVLKLEDLTARVEPVSLVTDASVSEADLQFVVGKAITSPLIRGNQLTWTAFADRKANAEVMRCADSVEKNYEAFLLTKAREQLKSRAFDALAEDSIVAPLPPPEKDATEFAVVVAARDVPEYSTLKAEDLVVRRIPAGLFTPSMVLEPDRMSLVGASVLVPLQEGDLLLWQFLRNPVAPRSARTCARAIHELTAKSAAEWLKASAAKAFEGKR